MNSTSANGTSATRGRVAYRFEDIARIRDSIRASKGAAAESGEETRVRIIVPPTLDAAHYVDASIQLSSDAYVLVVAADLDGRVRVLYPESPEESGFLTAQAPHKLSKFFAGFGSAGSRRYSNASFSTNPMALYSSNPVYRYAERGAIIAIASERPLQIARIADENGGWNEVALERLVFGRSMRSAGYALASELSLAGQQFDVGFSGLSTWGAMGLLSQSAFGSPLCQSEFDDALYYDEPRPTRFFVHQGVRYAAVTVARACGRYETQIVPIGPVVPINPHPVDSTSTTPPDSAPEMPVSSRIARRINSSDSTRALAIEQMGETVSRARRSSPMNSDGSSLKPADAPVVVGGLRFRPPERVRTEPVVRGDAGYGLAADPESARARRDGAFRNSERPLPVREERQGAQPARSEPLPVREAPARNEPAPAREAPARPAPEPRREAPTAQAAPPAPVAPATNERPTKPVKE